MTFAHFTLATRDVAATKQFFQNVFGWQPAQHQSNIPASLDAAWLEIGPGQEMHLLRVAEFVPSDFEREYGRHIALYHPSTDFPDLKQRLTEYAAELIAPLRESPVERFFFRDPNGYVFEVIAR